MGKSGHTMTDIMDILQMVEQDTDIQGLILRLDHMALMPAQVDEIRDMILNIRKKGKKVLAYADNFEGMGMTGTLAYYLACACDEIWMQNMGQVGIQGLIMELPFAKKAMEKLGVKSLMGQRHEYKGAADTLKEEKLPEPQRANMQALGDSFMRVISSGIQKGRELTEGQVKQYIDEAPWTDKEAKRLGLIDKIAYNDELVEFFLKEGESQMPEILKAGEYLKRRSYSGSTAKLREHISSATKLINNDDSSKDPVTFAIVYAEGDIIHDVKGDHSFKNQMKMGGHAVAEAIMAAAHNKDVRAIIVRMNTGGGSPTGSELIRRAVEKARKFNKKVVVSMAGMAASGGYWISTSADKIVAQPLTITGSIGVYSGKLYTAGLWEKLGIFWDEVHVGENATHSSQSQPYTEQGQKQLDAQLDRIYEEFVKRVGDARKLSPEHVNEIARGRVWSGADALKFGLVDASGGLETAVELALKELNLDPDTPVELMPYPKERSFAEKLQGMWFLDFDGVGAKVSTLFEGISGLYNTLVRTGIGEQGIQMRGALPS